MNSPFAFASQMHCIQGKNKQTNRVLLCQIFTLQDLRVQDLKSLIKESINVLSGTWWHLGCPSLIVFYVRFSHAFSGDLTVWSSWGSVGRNVVSPLCGYTCAFSDYWSLKILSHSMDTSVSSPHYATLNAHLALLSLRISFHRGCNGMVSLQCGFVCGLPRLVSWKIPFRRSDKQKVSACCAPSAGVWWG